MLRMGKETKKQSPVIIGVGIVVQREDGRILMKKRKGSHGEGEWALFGGRVEFGETFEQAALRELKEEAGIDGIGAEVISLSNQLRYACDGVHCVIIGVRTKIPVGAEPHIMEPEKCEAIEWIDLDNLPENVFEGSQQIILAIKGKGKKVVYIGND